MFIGLNPSTADESKDDPTIRRCMNYAKDWGYTALVMANLFAFRSTDPRRMLLCEDPVGPSNNDYLLGFAEGARLIVAAWGTGGDHLGRARSVKTMLPPMHVLRLTKGGHPGHPLYLPKSLRPQPWAA